VENVGGGVISDTTRARRGEGKEEEGEEGEGGACASGRPEILRNLGVVFLEGGGGGRLGEDVDIGERCNETRRGDQPPHLRTRLN
jgi:hypothetical protein